MNPKFSIRKKECDKVTQGDPLSCFLLLLLMTVVMHDAKEQYVHECRDRGLDASRRETIAIFGFEDVEFADDSNLFRCLYFVCESLFGITF